ncbi:MAG: Glycosyl transferase family 2 [Candidatus Woesebacteria bacterium GW2011_GWA1_37_8]|uniref:Glycosyl transferase family 2 n=2 Tax=Candidatus Woeseibacteriota TaxID=1752722 RepID=A0A0G0NLD7_9BACT|nr:MAG: Glycosyl transferase family 2 [Microgenomates group bacterium GW2011_GWC1_37_12b]KKQ46096.1 MAG: Glycosyl transferase family 2 [Candidatus Woesebacteria bacterium GW2011_GWA1_37_8]KKQ86704.1 MAG: Glycosyl transferase family 2 [Candidatus Woesebacteria bacterium GW2011_GWB1_38_8b]
MNKKTISAVIIAKNEEKNIDDCLKSVTWCDEIVVVDTDSTDKTVKIAEKFTNTIYKTKGGNYSDWRNLGLEKAKTDWIIYIDCDERCSDKLKNEILEVINSETKYSLFVIPRQNIILGRLMKHGGWWPDYVKRLYKKNHLKKWTGDLHEEPIYLGKLGYLENPLIHLKHNNLTDMLEKTNTWSAVEAQLMFKANHPKMNTVRFITAMSRELWKRLFVEKGYLDGQEGIIYSIYQMYSKSISYAKLWEMQENKLKI